MKNYNPSEWKKGRLGQPDAPTTPSEFQSLRSAIYKVAWVGRESRPEAAGAASILAGRLSQATTRDISKTIQMIKHLRSTASRAITIWPLNPDTFMLSTLSDAGGSGSSPSVTVGGDDGSPKDPTQAWMVLCADQDLTSQTGSCDSVGVAPLQIQAPSIFHLERRIISIILRGG